MNNQCPPNCQCTDCMIAAMANMSNSITINRTIMPRNGFIMPRNGFTLWQPEPPLPEAKEIVEDYLEYLAHHKLWKQAYELFGEVNYGVSGFFCIDTYIEPKSLEDYLMYRELPNNKEVKELIAECEKMLKLSVFL